MTATARTPAGSWPYANAAEAAAHTRIFEATIAALRGDEQEDEII